MSFSHTSSGISRTGVFIAADTGMRELEEKNEVDVLNIVSSLRQDRGGMVQTKDQYVFLHKVGIEYMCTTHIDSVVVFCRFS